ncbi:flagellar export protein FliJ [Clostridiaceae bacterium M8S5]|nr:flagellar export protein FliJ [Clostridiaceae bacterium M8S5]
MNKFKFKLQGILNYKQVVEDMKSVELINANEELKNQEEILDNTMNQKEHLNRQKNDTKLTTIQNLRNINTFINVTNEKIKKQNKMVETAKDIVDEKKVELINASKDKKILEKLKTKKYKEFLVIEKRNEEKIIDQINSFNSCNI